MRALDWIWKHLDGLKTIIGGILHATWFLYYVIFNKDISVEHQLTGHGIIGILTGVGIGHKIFKSKQSEKQNRE